MTNGNDKLVIACLDYEVLLFTILNFTSCDNNFPLINFWSILPLYTPNGETRTLKTQKFSGVLRGYEIRTLVRKG